MPKKNESAFVERLKQTAHLEIDEYVLQAANNYLAKLNFYRNNLNFDLALTERYEDIFYDKEGFLRRIFEHFGLQVEDEVFERVARDNDIRPEKEDVSQHIRKGAPGDHREKLRPETIQSLNQTFSDIFDWLGYDAESSHP